MTQKKVQPQAIELEEAVLGALMLDKNSLPIISMILRPEYFYADANGLIFSSILSLDARREPVDLLTVTNELKEKKNLEAVGGAHYLVGLTNRVASSSNIEVHAKIILQKWMKREMIAIAAWLWNESYEDGDIFEILTEFEKRFSGITNFTHGDAKKVGDVIPDVLREAKEIYDRGGELVGINLTGIEDFERQHGGGMSGDFITISGDTGSGKSSFFNNILCQAVLDGFPVYSWSGEMTPQQQTTRMLAAFSGINSLKIKAGKYIDDVNDFTSLENAIEKIIGKDVFLDFGHMNIQKLTSTIINKHRVEGIKVFLLDRLELFDLSVKRDEDQAKGVFTSRLRSLANELGVTIVMAAQLRKSFESRPRKIPEIVDIKGAGAIIQDSTKIFLLYRPELYGLPEFEDGFTSDGKGEIFIKKNSHGGLGKERVDFNKYQTTWGVNFHLAPTASSGATGLTKDGFLTDDAGENKSSLTGPKNSPDEGVPF